MPAAPVPPLAILPSMSEQSDAVLAYWNEHRQQLRQSETQRAALTNYLLVITAGLSGFVVQQRFATATIAVACLMIGTGLYGALAVAKYHERARYHLMQARALTKTLEDSGVLPDDSRLQSFRDSHYADYPRLHKVRLHLLWTGLHLAIAVYGVVLAVVILVG
jgi:hypothetical protein